MVADVTGHGFASALLMALTHAYFRSLAEVSADVGEIMNHANAILEKETEDDRFVTVFLGRLDPRTRSFEYCSAGHPTGYLIDAAGNIKACLESESLPLGVDPDAAFPVSGPITLAAGDLLLLVTDGVLETQSLGGEYFGEQRMLDAVRARRDQPSNAIVAGLHNEVLAFSQPAEPADDITVIVVKLAAS